MTISEAETAEEAETKKKRQFFIATFTSDGGIAIERKEKEKGGE